MTEPFYVCTCLCSIMLYYVMLCVRVLECSDLYFNCTCTTGHTGFIPVLSYIVYCVLCSVLSVNIECKARVQ